MKFFIINLLLLVLLNALVFLNNNNIFIGVIVFGLLTYIPGSVFLAALSYNNKTFFEKLSLIAGLGTLFLILWGFGVNETYPLLGISEPLSLLPFIVGYNIIVSIFIFVVSIVNSKIQTSIAFPKTSLQTILFYLLSLVIPTSAILGAISLNNHGTNFIALFTYILIGLYSVLIFIYNKRLSGNKISFGLFIMSLSLLFMNSFRGWYNTGHDVQREFYVFNLTNTYNFWDINFFKDPYNACLSLTILPTIYANITKINDYFIFKILFQILFSFTIVNIFYLLRNYFSKSFAYLASLNFLFFPTFLTDLPMLNRQELAFFFLSHMLYVVFDKTIFTVKKTIIFIFMSIGMVLSHYSTSYVATILLLLTYTSSLFLATIQKVLSKIFNFRIELEHLDIKRNINFVMVLFLMLFTVFWNSIYTQTSGNLQNTIVKIIDNISHPFSENQKTGENLYSIFGFKPIPPEVSLNKYVKEKTQELRKPSNEKDFYDKNISNKYPVTINDMDVLAPIPLLSDLFKNNDVNIISNLRQSYAKIIQVLILIGMVLFIINRKSKYKLPIEYYLLSVISILLITVQLIVPQKAVEYGLLRLFQQSLMFFSIFIVLGLYWTLKIFFIRSTRIRETFVMIFILVFFFILSGVVPQLMGGYYPQLPLNNNGAYYNMYYTHNSELHTLKWVDPYVNNQSQLQSDSFDSVISNRSLLQSDSFDSAKIRTYANTLPIAATFPAVVKKSSYVYLNYSNTIFNSVYLYYSGGLLVYNYPIQFLNENKNLIYSTSETKIYR